MQNHAKKWFDNTNANAMAAIAIGAMLIFSVAGIKAFADNIQDDIQVTPAQKTITQGGSTTVNYWIDANNAGGTSFEGCDASDGSSVKITFNVPNGVTVSPDSLTFTQYGSSTTNTQSAKYSSDTPGDYDITVSFSDSHGNYNPNPAKFTLHVTASTPSDTTAPTIKISSPNDGDTKTTDSFTVSGTASDSGSGLEKVEVKIDDATFSTATLGTGDSWSFGVTNYPEGTHKITAQATDKAGNSATTSIQVTYTPPDTTAPKLSLPSSPITEEATSANGAAVTYEASASDAVDGSVPVSCIPASGSTFPLGTTPVNCSATDQAGNEAKGSFNVIVQDTTPPVITVNSAISNEQQFYFGDVPSAPTCSATDTASGVNNAGCQVSGYATTVGPHTLTFTATDNAGNTATQTIKYTVLAWKPNGFFQPVDMNGVLNTVKGGSTVPFKFEIFKDTTELTSTTFNGNPIGTFSAKKVACDGSATLDEIEVLGSGSTGLRYDSTSGQFIYNWQTPKGAGTCYDTTFTAQDGSPLTAHFRTK